MSAAVSLDRVSCTFGTGAQAAGFGRLDYAHTMRWVIPGVTLTALGFQTVLASFFVAVLGSYRR